jgi:hypothetical protein
LRVGGIPAVDTASNGGLYARQPSSRIYGEFAAAVCVKQQQSVSKSANIAGRARPEQEPQISAKKMIAEL